MELRTFFFALCFIIPLAASILAQPAAAASTGHLTILNGQSVRVIDNCLDKNHPCAAGQCCVKEGLAYIPEYTGPKPAYQIACKPLRKQGELCYKRASTEMCPCASGLTCSGSRIFGHCS